MNSPPNGAPASPLLVLSASVLAPLALLAGLVVFAVQSAVSAGINLGSAGLRGRSRVAVTVPRPSLLAVLCCLLLPCSAAPVLKRRPLEAAPPTSDLGASALSGATGMTIAALAGLAALAVLTRQARCTRSTRRSCARSTSGCSR